MNFPRIKESLRPVRAAPTRILMGGFIWGLGVEIEDDDDGTVWHLLGLMDGQRSCEVIVAELRSAHPDLDEQSIREAIGSLIDSGFAEEADPGAIASAGLSREERERYGRGRHYLSWVDRSPQPSPWELQRRLKRSRVCILGIGGTGSIIATSLAATGIGALTCVDPDTVELPNLNRAVLFSEADVGRLKVAAAAEKLRALNRHVEVTTRSERIASGQELDELMAGHDLVVLCADEPADLAEKVNDAALRAGTPWQICLYAGPMVLAAVFAPGKTACWKCIPRADPPRGEDLLYPSRPHPVIAASAGLTGQMGALLATYFLAGLPVPAMGRVFKQSLIRPDHAYFLEPSDEPCLTCGRRGGSSTAIARPISDPQIATASRG